MVGRKQDEEAAQFLGCNSTRPGERQSQCTPLSLGRALQVFQSAVGITESHFKLGNWRHFQQEQAYTTHMLPVESLLLL